jgi:hypothetical protein
MSIFIEKTRFLPFLKNTRKTSKKRHFLAFFDPPPKNIENYRFFVIFWPFFGIF